jgi:hypothetical protein
MTSRASGRCVDLKEAHVSYQVRIGVSFAFILALGSACASGALVEPGERLVPLDSAGLVLPISGAVVAQSTLPFHLDYVLRSPEGFELVAPSFVDGSVTTQVIRTDATGTLAFLYTFAFTSRQSGSEQSELTWDNFGQFTTDVQYVDQTTFNFGRSANGSTLEQDKSGGNANVPTVAFFTNATDFNDNGTLLVHLGDETVAREIDNPTNVGFGFASGDTLVTGAFQPVPLPAAVWAGAFALPIAIAARRRIGS